MLRFGILHRYILGQMLRAFLLALVTITVIFSLFVVMAEATRQGLAPHEVLGVLPYLVPGSLPYTVPVALLFCVTVVYGRLAGDNEVSAMKSSGLSIWTVLAPAIWLGVSLTAMLFATSTEIIPRANNAVRRILFGSAEDSFYRYLKKEKEISNPKMPIWIQVSEVRGRTLIEPIFKHRAPSPPNPPGTFDLIVRAKTARIQFDLDRELAIVELEDAETTGDAHSPFLMEVQGKKILQYPFPKPPADRDRRVQELTNGEINELQAEYQEKVDHERTRQATKTSLWVAAGRIERVDWGEVRASYLNYPWWMAKQRELETEKYVRVALASGAIFFVMLGAPVGILFAKRDFLSAFITCFVPIIVLYYPLVLAGINISKEGLAGKLGYYIVFDGNVLLGVLAGLFALPPVWKH